eukprot:TRINITY_DN326_c0_g1_i13.p2 TRINITY_DN326_c0_g1~~TRINITY_DN326_c0_g1_i13.p2  ORF type:complete len:369 (-),score=106.66 TRINITY_DN326_c0_g1_i13:40-1146(-)
MAALTATTSLMANPAVAQAMAAATQSAPVVPMPADTAHQAAPVEAKSKSGTKMSSNKRPHAELQPSLSVSGVIERLLSKKQRTSTGAERVSSLLSPSQPPLQDTCASPPSQQLLELSAEAGQLYAELAHLQGVLGASCSLSAPLLLESLQNALTGGSSGCTCGTDINAECTIRSQLRSVADHLSTSLSQQMLRGTATNAAQAAAVAVSQAARLQRDAGAQLAELRLRVAHAEKAHEKQLLVLNEQHAARLQKIKNEQQKLERERGASLSQVQLLVDRAWADVSVADREARRLIDEINAVHKAEREHNKDRIARGCQVSEPQCLSCASLQTTVAQLQAELQQLQQKNPPAPTTTTTTAAAAATTIQAQT